MNNLISPIYFTNNNYPPYSKNEIFVKISDFIPEIIDRYFISNYGRVFNSNTNDFNKPFYDTRDNSGNYYCRVRLITQYGIQKAYSIHRLVITCFFPELGSINQKLQVNHKDGLKSHNYVNPINYDKSNLEWLTPSENVQHAFKNNLNSQIGEKNSCCKITKDIVIKISQLLLENKYSDKDIANIIGNNVTPYIVSNIRNKNSWAYLTESFSFPKRKQSKIFSDKDIHNFCSYLYINRNSAKTKKELCINALKEFGFEATESNINALLLINRGVTYKNIRQQYDY